MDDPTQHLRELAGRVVEAALERAPLRAALLAGSAARGDADFWSDLDLLLYVVELPPEGTLDTIRIALGGTNPVCRGEASEHFRSEEFELGGIRTEVSFMTVARVEWQLDRLLGELEAAGSPYQKVLLGLLEGMPLHGGEQVERWQARLRDYPQSLRLAMIERHWSFLPVWYHGEAMAARDAELWRLDALLDAAFNLLGVLAGLNRVYYARFELKRLRKLEAQLELAPPNLADRLESLFRLEPETAATELGRLVEETQAIVAAELPDVDVSLRHPPGERERPWSPS